MLTKADDYPVHQLPEPIAISGTDRNFYDRYFFNGYTLDGHVFFACALGVYPHLNVMDAAFSVIVDGVQHNLRASRLLNSERMDTRVGPIQITVIEPLKILRVQVHDNEHGITADLTFDARAQAVEEPRFTYRQGPRTMMDYTRLTQNGLYEGHIDVRGTHIDDRPRHGYGHARPLLGRAPDRCRRSARGCPAAATAILLAVGAAQLSRPLHALSQQCRSQRQALEHSLGAGRTGPGRARAHGQMRLHRHLQIRHAPCRRPR